MILLPLEVLPGWPQPEPVSDLALVMLTIVGPLALGAVITLLAFAPRFARRQSGQASASTQIEPVERP